MTISHSSLPADSYCVIMAGGIGNRFWPVSNTQCPKQFSDILHTGKSFIRQTYERISRIFRTNAFSLSPEQNMKRLHISKFRNFLPATS